MELFLKDEYEGIIKHNNRIIYDGYIDYFITSEYSELELNLNYGEKYNLSSVILRKIGGDIIFIPNLRCCFEKEYKYIPIVFSIEKLEELWTNLGYRFVDDIDYLKEVTAEEILLSWYISSGVRCDVLTITEYVSEIFNKIVYVSEESYIINKKIKMLLNYKQALNKIDFSQIYLKNKSDRRIIVYLDDINIEWDAIVVKEENIYLNLQNNKIIPIVI